ncbi:hypothetical protein EUTSA_v10016114mg [Eutrema salsugineum]|uniref:Uncharacterized protein n=1 Tax=Eutrema salsugineum TaxID=72664 RepID=V4LUQ9_EUTSA|nr:hypothetical protein EUTSA_v10016114mg [Eutrema salsugineum]ESQ43614.1 hypothetical protein EUTSA_v10016114mg [Eutrema salsugineum]
MSMFSSAYLPGFKDYRSQHKETKSPRNNGLPPSPFDTKKQSHQETPRKKTPRNKTRSGPFFFVFFGSMCCVFGRCVVFCNFANNKQCPQMC